MREELAKRVGKRGKFQATFQRTGIRKNNYGVVVTALFTDVRDEAGTLVTDHLWFYYGRQMEALKLEAGVRVSFVATVAPYMKRNPDLEFEDDAPYKVVDYRLIYPCHLRRVDAGAQAPLPLFEQPAEAS